jgi:hypothetical protein
MELQKSRFYIGFDPLIKKQVEEAKKIYQQSRMENRVILNPSDFSEINSWGDVKDGFTVDAEQVAENTFAIRILDETGDRRLIWDLRSPKETNEAQQKFEEYLAKGWKAYAIDRKGKKSYRIMSFDAESQEVVFDEKSPREKLVGFIKKISEVRLNPPTYPG